MQILNSARNYFAIQSWKTGAAKSGYITCSSLCPVDAFLIFAHHELTTVTGARGLESARLAVTIIADETTARTVSYIETFAESLGPCRVSIVRTLHACASETGGFLAQKMAAFAVGEAEFRADKALLANAATLFKANCRRFSRTDYFRLAAIADEPLLALNLIDAGRTFCARNAFLRHRVADETEEALLGSKRERGLAIRTRLSRCPNHAPTLDASVILRAESGAGIGRCIVTCRAATINAAKLWKGLEPLRTVDICLAH